MDMKRSLKVVIGFVLASALAGCQTTFYEVGTTPITLSFAVVAGFEKYKQTDNPLFFAVSTNGQRYYYYWCDTIYCDPDFSGQAISLCERRSGGVDCKIFAFERSIVWKGPITYPHIPESDAILCKMAITVADQPLGWDAGMQVREFVTKAKLRGLTPEGCAKIIGR